jgi:hypothetical protein
LGLGSHNFHFVPVIAEFFTAIQARNIGSGPLRNRIVARAGANRYRKAISCVPATKHSIYQLGKHLKPSTEEEAQNQLITFRVPSNEPF